MYAIQVHNLNKKYKNGVQALNGLNLSVKKGEVFSLLGPNGAGKSTLIRILTTFLKPDTGKVSMSGQDICSQAAQIRPRIACVAQQTSIDTHLSLKENMIFQSRLYKMPRDDAQSRMNALIEEFALEQYLKHPVASYSGGIKRRLDIAVSLMTNPEILFLDEPTVGMDIQSRRSMWDMIQAIRNTFGTTIFLTTHYLEEADSLSDTICIMKDGKDIIQGTPSELKAYIRNNTLQIKFPDNEHAQKYFPTISTYFSENDMAIRENTILIDTANNSRHLKETVLFLTDKDIRYTGIEIMQPSLEDVFLRLTATEKPEVNR